MQLKLWRLGAGATCGVIIWAATACTDPPVAARPAGSVAYDTYTGPTTGFRTQYLPDSAPTAASVKVLAKNRTDFDFRIRMVSPSDVLFPPCPEPCAPMLSRDQPSLQAGDSFPLGTFPGGTRVDFIVIACRPDYVELCFIANTPPIGGSETLGWVTFGAAVSPTNYDFNDFVFKVFLTPVPPPDTLKVTVTVRRDSIRPVMAACFDAVAQTAYPTIPHTSVGQDPCDPALQRGAHVVRTDTARVTIHAFFAPSGRPAAGGSVTLTATPRDSGGGHIHGFGVARPKGTFFLGGEDINRDGEDSARVGQIALTLSATGDAQPVYRTSGVSGSEVLSVRVQAEGRVAVKTDSVVVAVPGLVELTTGGNVDTVGPTTTHPDSHWGTPAMVANLRALGDSLYSRYAIHLQVNDMSLKLGSLFDLNADWRPPHLEHRVGTSADVRIPTDGRQQDRLRECWYETNGLTASQAVTNEAGLVGVESNHYHLRLRRGL